MSVEPLASTPSADGFAMPAEYERHEGCYLVWPQRPDNWRLQARPAQEAFAAVANAIVESESVTMVVAGEEHDRARSLLDPRVELMTAPTDDAWARDTGPTFVVNQPRTQRRAVDWIFNAWGGANGGLYGEWDRDDALAAAIAQRDGAERYRAPLVLEGGAIHVDGQGTCLTTHQCLGHPNRNPNLTIDEIEDHLCDYLGVTTVVWLPVGIPNDETDGHIDNLACFAGSGRVLLAYCDDPSSPHYEVSQRAAAALGRQRDAQGRPFEVIHLPVPRPLVTTPAEAAGVLQVRGTVPRRAGDPLAASYVNFYVGNDVIVFPLLDRDHDEEVSALLAETFPGRRPVGVDAREILLGGGGIHCITQQVPG